jgi:K+-sensing histidine kinase KdpD
MTDHAHDSYDPPFIFEHLIVLLVVVIAIPWGLGPAILAAVVSVVSDNVLLREPIGRPTISGYRDVLDLLLRPGATRAREPDQ